jgi:hypothetical protein
MNDGIMSIVNKSIADLLTGAWPSGKATDFESVYRRFESYRPSLAKTSRSQGVPDTSAPPERSGLRPRAYGTQPFCWRFEASPRPTARGRAFVPQESAVVGVIWLTSAWMWELLRILRYDRESPVGLKPRLAGPM